MKSPHKTWKPSNCCDHRWTSLNCFHLYCGRKCYRCHTNRPMLWDNLSGGWHGNWLKHSRLYVLYYGDVSFACFHFSTHLTPRTPHATERHHDVIADIALMQHKQTNYCFVAFFRLLVEAKENSPQYHICSELPPSFPESQAAHMLESQKKPGYLGRICQWEADRCPLQTHQWWSR